MGQAAPELPRAQAARAGSRAADTAVAAAPGEALLAMTGICKRFPGVLALDQVDFDLRGGEVHVLFGENGAGKSTLINIIAGTFPADAGEMRYRGTALAELTPHRARVIGISPVFQEFSLVPDLTRRGQPVPRPREEHLRRARPQHDAPAGARDDRGTRVRRSAGAAGARTVARASADGGDHQGAADRCTAADPRRAHRIADRGRGGAAVRADRAAEGRRRRASSMSRTGWPRSAGLPTGSRFCATGARSPPSAPPT